MVVIISVNIKLLLTNTLSYHFYHALKIVLFIVLLTKYRHILKGYEYMGYVTYDIICIRLGTKYIYIYIYAQYLSYKDPLKTK